MKELWQDQAFLGLPPEEKHKVLMQIDSDYAGLPIAEQSKVSGFKISSQPQQPLTDVTSESLGMFSPTQAGKGAQMFAPEIGMTAGGLLGSRIPIPGAQPFLTGVGYASGEAIKQGEIPTLDQFAQNFGKGAAMEFGGKALGKLAGGAIKGLSWLSGKGGEKVAEGLQKIKDFTSQLTQQGLPMPPATAAGQRLADKAARSYPGNVAVQKAHEQIRIGAEEMLNNFKTQYGINEYTKEAADKAFNDWANMLGGGDAPLDLPLSQKFIAETMDKPFVTALPEKTKNWWATQAATFLQNPTVQGLRDIWSTLGIKGASGADKTARNKLAGIITTELKEGYGEEAATALEFAKNQNAWFKKVSKLKSIINGSYDRTGGSETFMPDRFARLWEQSRNNPIVFKNFTKDEIAEIDQFAGLMGTIGGELKRKVSDKGFGVLEATPLLGALVTGAMRNPTEAAIPLALGAIPPALSMRAAQAYNPQSWLYQKALRNVGQAREMIPGLVNIGGKLILKKYAENGGEGW